MYSDSIAFSGMMDDMESVLRRLRWELNMGSGGGLVRGNSGMTMTTITVWAMGTAWTMANGRREMRK